MKLEDRLRSGKLVPWWLTLTFYISAGRSHTDFIINALKMGGYAAILLYAFGIDIRESRWLIVIIAILYNFVMFITGWGWDRIKGFDRANEWSNKRNPMLRKINENVAKNSDKI